jgi:hypothetical protein
MELPSNTGLPPELLAAPLLEPLLLDAPPELLAPLPEPEPAGGPLSPLQAAATRRAAQQIAQTKVRVFILPPGGLGSLDSDTVHQREW